MVAVERGEGWRDAGGADDRHGSYSDGATTIRHQRCDLGACTAAEVRRVISGHASSDGAPRCSTWRSGLA
jgi:hypothetical protein